MIAGVGTDMIEIARIKRACEKKAFLTRVYTQEECQQAGENYSRLAGTFAVKALGTGFRSFGPREIEVLRDDLGKPFVRLHGGAKKLAEELAIQQIHVSITNTAEYAAAFAVGERADQ